jgi:hypothetical protein
MVPTYNRRSFQRIPLPEVTGALDGPGTAR